MPERIFLRHFYALYLKLYAENQDFQSRHFGEQFMVLTGEIQGGS